MILTKARAAATVSRANLRVGEAPDRYLRALWQVRRFGASTLGGLAASVVRSPDRDAVVLGEDAVTYRELWDASHALAAALTDTGRGVESRIGLLCGNGIDFVQALVAAHLLGSTVVLLNTGFAAPQLAAVAADERLDLVICDDDTRGLVVEAGLDTAMTTTECASLVEAHRGRTVRPPARRGRVVLLTSGTTGHPKGAVRPPGGELEGTAAVLGRVPLRHRDTRVVAAPLFHGWGLTHLLLGLGMSATVVLQRRFDPEDVLRLVARHRARVLVLVPVMLQRVLDVPPRALAAADTSSLRVIVCSGSAMPSWVATQALRRFGPVVYNVYGSTEVAVASIATPADLQVQPQSAGRPAPGVVVRVLDEQDRPARRGTVGRVFVGSAMPFEGYTSGGGKSVVDGLLSSGDMGCFDRRGRLIVVGREDDMIVSGGENVYPREVEDLLAGHPDIAEVAVAGVPDEAFGQVLQAWVVPREGAALEEATVQAHVGERLARFKVPRRVVLVEALPRNAMGKVVPTRLDTSEQGATAT